MSKNEKLYVAFFSFIALGTTALIIYLQNKKERSTKFSLNMLSASDSIKSYIKKQEGLRLQPYTDANFQSIGYGHQIQSSEYYLLSGIDQDKADQLFEGDVKKAEQAIYDNVTVDLSQNQFDAIVDFIFNLGSGAFKNSTLLSLINMNAEPEAIANEMNKWNHSQGVVLATLTDRRNYEANLFTA